MVKIELNNPYLKRINKYEKSEKIKVTIKVNNQMQEIESSKPFAITFSEVICSHYIRDNTFQSVDSNTELKSSETLPILNDIFQFNEKSWECNEIVLKDLFRVGLNLQIQDLIDLYQAHVINNMVIDKNNCIELLEFYFDISDEDKLKECINFISANFYGIDLDKLKLISKKLGLSILQQIICNDLISVKDEDSLANFVISLTEDSNIFNPLYEGIHFEFCIKLTLYHLKELIDADNDKNICVSLCQALIRAVSYTHLTLPTTERV